MNNTTLLATHDGDYPATWDWAAEGSTVEGRFVRMESGQTRKFGSKPILILDVESAERSIWVFGRVFVNQLVDELRRRGAKEFQTGETIRVHRSPELTQTQDGSTSYRRVRCEFPDAPNSSALEILDRAASSAPIENNAGGPLADDQDLPF